MIYTFPAWLFHAALFAKYSNYGGGPELVLRVLNHAPQADYRIFKTADQVVVELVKQMLKSRNEAVLDVSSARTETSVFYAALQKRAFGKTELLLREGADRFQVRLTHPT